MEYGYITFVTYIIIQLKYWFQLKISGDVFYLHGIWILHLLLIIILF